jgi:hypothetical protein
LNTQSYGHADVQVREEDLERRISALVALFDSRAEASRVAQLSTDQLLRYERGGSPSFVPLARLCLAKDVSLKWLATGEGQMVAGVADMPASQGFAKPSQDPRPSSAPMDPGLLTSAVRVTEAVLRERGIRDRVNADQFAELVRIMYNDMAQGRAEDAASEALARILSMPR